ncbi:MAG: YtxH domain-containing protein [Gemmatimonadales bacterium]
MITQQRRIDDTDPWFADRSGRGGPGAGSLLLATLFGIGVGLLAAPQPGTKTRKELLKRLAALSEGMGEGLEEAQHLSSKARKRAKQRLAKLREEAGEEWEDVEDRWARAKTRLRDLEFGEREDSGAFGKLLAIAASLATTYFLTSDRTATARSRVQDAAVDVGRRASDQWDRFQRGGIPFHREKAESDESRSETRAASPPSGEASQAT